MTRIAPNFGTVKASGLKGLFSWENLSWNVSLNYLSIKAVFILMNLILLSKLRN